MPTKTNPLLPPAVPETPPTKTEVKKYDHFQEVPQFTKTANYEVTIPWSHLESNLRHYIDEDLLDMDPDFQRAHVWTQAQQVAYVEFILRGGNSGKDVYLNARGWHRGHREKGTFVLVDGKQRLEAVRRFLRNEIPAFGTLYRDFKGVLRITEERFTFHINDLETREEVLRWYLEMNSAGTPHTEAELQKVRDMLARES